jgi:beta-1,4-mannosyltransferase
MTTRILSWPAFSNRAPNPYNRLLFASVRKRAPSLVVEDFSPSRFLTSRCDVWHIHWPERLANKHSRVVAAVNLAVFAVFVVLARLRGTKLVWTIHNLEDHQGRHPGWERRFMAWFVLRLDGAISLTEPGFRLAVERYPGLGSTPTAVIPHGHYLDAYPNTIGREEARAVLGLREEQRVIAFVGRISGYKNVPGLIRVFGSLPDQDLRLVIAGEPQSAALRREVESAASDPRIQLQLRDIRDDELQVFLNAADLAVFPFERILNSGSVLLALSFLRPVLVPAIESMVELRDELGTDWMRTYTGGLTAEALRAAIAPETLADLDPAGLRRRLVEDRGWDGIADLTISFYRDLVATGGCP